MEDKNVIYQQVKFNPNFFNLIPQISLSRSILFERNGHFQLVNYLK